METEARVSCKHEHMKIAWAILHHEDDSFGVYVCASMSCPDCLMSFSLDVRHPIALMDEQMGPAMRFIPFGLMH